MRVKVDAEGGGSVDVEIDLRVGVGVATDGRVFHLGRDGWELYEPAPRHDAIARKVDTGGRDGK